MNQREKIYELKDTVVQLYCKEGKSKQYIANLLGVNRIDLSHIIDMEWELSP